MATLTDSAVTAAGVYDLTHEAYHADPVPGGSLSASGAKRLLPPSCPALYRYAVDHPPESTRAMEFGSAAHTLVLGTGPEVVLVEADDYRTKAAREERDAAQENGAVPLLRPEFDRAWAMAMALRAHPIAGAIFDPYRGGQAEQSLFWQADDIWKRARFDWLPAWGSNGRLIVPDYKTARSAEPGRFARSAADLGYHLSAAWYIEGAKALELAEDVAFIFIVQEKDPPYLVSVVELDRDALRLGRSLADEAVGIYRQCKETDTWPGYSTEVERVSLPAWAFT